MLAIYITRFKLDYVQVFVDRHGRVRHYFRRHGYPRVALPGQPGSSEFMEAYLCALAGAPVAPVKVAAAKRERPETGGPRRWS
jgi:hypothetical protein